MKQAESFMLPEGARYLCGHSLGPCTTLAMQHLQQGMQGWKSELVNGWASLDWINVPQILGQALARLIGAHADEVIVADSTSINLLKCLLAASQLNSHRKVLLTEHENFPADRYIAASLSAINKDYQIKSVANDDILQALNETVAVLLLTHVNYRSSQMHDMALLTQKAHEQGIVVVWDLSHSVGAMPLNCSELHVDFAVGCTYKYLNGGPGAPGFIFIAQRLHQRAMPMIKGWMGHAAPFAFAQDYVRAKGIKAFLTGTPPILSLKSLEGALKIFQHVDLAQLRQQSMSLSQQLITSLAEMVPQLCLVSPEDPLIRGSHVAYSHPLAEKIVQELIARGVIVDYRSPELIRFGIAPLYLDSQDIEHVVQIVSEVAKSLR